MHVCLAFENIFKREFKCILLENELAPSIVQIVVKPQALSEEMANIHEHGFNSINEEMEEGVICGVTPVFDNSSQLKAAIFCKRDWQQPNKSLVLRSSRASTDCCFGFL